MLGVNDRTVKVVLLLEVTHATSYAITNGPINITVYHL